MTRTLACLLGAVMCAGQDPPAPVGPGEWVPFSADIRITFANGKEARGRHVQDEHGCSRNEMVHPDGSRMIMLINFEKEMAYQLYRGAWTSRPLRVGQIARTPTQMRVSRQAEPIEGFDAYIAEPLVRTPKGEYKDAVTVIPALNFFRAASVSPGGDRRVAANIKVAPQPRGEFLPPPGARVTEQPSVGVMTFRSIGLRLGFAGQDPFDAVTREQAAYAVKTPSGIPLTLVATVDDPAKLVIRIRVLANAKGRPGDVRGKLLDEIFVALGSTVATTKLRETLTIEVIRVGTATK
jgi:hypothetical protein